MNRWDRLYLKGRKNNATGEKYLYEQPDGKWRIYIRLKDGRIAHRRFLDKDDALDWRDEKLREFGVVGDDDEAAD